MTTPPPPPGAPADVEARVAAVLATARARDERAGDRPAGSFDRVDAGRVRTLVTAAGVQLSPVAAIMGGIVAQEVVKLVSRKDDPINNWFFFDAMGGTGGVECLV